MASWLYQMSALAWDEAQYRLQVWERETVYWPAGQIRGAERPRPGDRIFCWYAKTGSAAPGLCGWGVVLGYEPDGGEVSWRPVSPNDVLKMSPIYAKHVAQRVTAIRGRVAQGTMWAMSEQDAMWFAARIVEHGTVSAG